MVGVIATKEGLNVGRMVVLFKAGAKLVQGEKAAIVFIKEGEDVQIILQLCKLQHLLTSSHHMQLLLVLVVRHNELHLLPFLIDPFLKYIKVFFSDAGDDLHDRLFERDAISVRGLRRFAEVEWDFVLVAEQVLEQGYSYTLLLEVLLSLLDEVSHRHVSFQACVQKVEISLEAQHLRSGVGFGLDHNHVFVYLFVCFLNDFV